MKGKESGAKRVRLLNIEMFRIHALRAIWIFAWHLPGLPAQKLLPMDKLEEGAKKGTQAPMATKEVIALPFTWTLKKLITFTSLSQTVPEQEAKVAQEALEEKGAVEGLQGIIL